MEATTEAKGAEMQAMGITDEVTTCDCCGRENLKRTVAMGDAGGLVGYYGTDCAAKATGRPAKDIRTEAKAADEAARRAKMAAEGSIIDDYERWARETTGTESLIDAIRALGGLSAARAAYVDVLEAATV